jgi:hypothetical protein
VDDSTQTNRKKRKKRVFPQQSREEGVGCRSTFSSSRRLKKAFKKKLAEKEPKRTLKKKELKRGQKSTQDPETV